MALTYEGQYLRLRITGDEESFPTLLDISSFLYDVNLLYEFLRLSLDPAHERFTFSQYAFYRRGRPLSEVEQLHIQSLRLGSPIDVVTVVAVIGGAIGAFAGLVAIIQNLHNAPLNRRKLAAEVEKLERENRVASREEILRAFEDLEGLGRRLGARESEHLVQGITRRLASSPVRIEKIDVEVVTSQELERHESDDSTSNNES
jgi:hypothetical protein